MPSKASSIDNAETQTEREQLQSLVVNRYRFNCLDLPCEACRKRSWSRPWNLDADHETLDGFLSTTKTNGG